VVMDVSQDQMPLPPDHMLSIRQEEIKAQPWKKLTQNDKIEEATNQLQPEINTGNSESVRLDLASHCGFVTGRGGGGH